LDADLADLGVVGGEIRLVINADFRRSPSPHSFRADSAVFLANPTISSPELWGIFPPRDRFGDVHFEDCSGC
jgi:hypothetical protein